MYHYLEQGLSNKSNQVEYNGEGLASELFFSLHKRFEFQCEFNQVSSASVNGNQS